MRIRVLLLGLGTALVSALLALPASVVSAVADSPCPAGQTTSDSYTDRRGVTIYGGRCIPGTQIPGDATYGYEYKRLCRRNVPDACAPRPCDEDGVAKPSYLFAVTRITLSTGDREARGGGCYTVKDTPPEITPAKMQEVVKTIPIKPATLLIQPPGGKTLVNLKTIVSSDAAPFEVDVPVFEQTVHVWLRPVDWTWNFGDDSEPLVTHAKGRAWEQGVGMSQIIEPDFTFHEYATTGAVDVTLTVTWIADYQAPGKQPERVPGSVNISSPAQTITVVEAKPQLVLH